MRRDYPSAARALGYHWTRILFRHLLPNAIAPIVVYLMTDMALCILLGSSLGYLGLGAQPPTAEWGVLIADGKNFMTTAWWMSVFPGIAIVLAGHRLQPPRQQRGGAGGPPRMNLMTRPPPLLSVQDLTDRNRRKRPRRRRDLRGGAGRGAGPRRRVRLGQEPVAAGDPKLLPPHATVAGPHPVRRPRPPAAAAKRRSARAGRRIAMVFQEPMTALDPVLPIGLQIVESLTEHLGLDARSTPGAGRRPARSRRHPRRPRRLDAYPHEFSGGMRQRAMIAIALAARAETAARRRAHDGPRRDDPGPDPEAAAALKDELGMSIVIVTHDLGVVARDLRPGRRHVCGTRRSRPARSRPCSRRPRHAYTRGLIALGAAMRRRCAASRSLSIDGQPARPRAGCRRAARFHPRCGFGTGPAVARAAARRGAGCRSRREPASACIHADRVPAGSMVAT